MGSPGNLGRLFPLSTVPSLTCLLEIEETKQSTRGLEECLRLYETLKGCIAWRLWLWVLMVEPGQGC